MRGHLNPACAISLVAGLMMALPGLSAALPAPPDLGVAHVTVTVEVRHPGANPLVTPQDVKVYEANQGRPVVSWVAAKASGPLDLTILLDESISGKVGLQFKDLANFFPTLPAATRVRVAYASYGTIRVAQNFTTDYPLAAKALQLPVGSSAAGGSIYQSVVDVIKHWPQQSDRRALLLISDGVDINTGYQESYPSLNPDLQNAINVAQSSNIPVYTIFVRGPRMLERNWFLFDNGQGCLARLASESGGQSFFEGTYTPIDFAPYLKQLSSDLHNQYVLTFQVLPASGAGYRPLRVTTEVPGVRLLAPTRVFVSKAG